jgi:hypothetical protein
MLLVVQPDGTVVELSEEAIGGLPELPNPVPASISDRQFAQQLAVLGTISEAEALAWSARGDLPAAVETAIAALPEEERFGARMLLSSATFYERGHPLVPVLGGLLGYQDEAIDDIWRAAAIL